jgi:hypothetical protein
MGARADGHEAVWLCQRLSIACARHERTRFTKTTTQGDSMRSTAAAAIGAVSAAAVLSGVGLAAASASPASPAIEYFHSMTTSGTASQISVIATGVFTAGGVDITRTAATDIFKFPGGTISVTHHSVHVTKAFNRKTCLFTGTDYGTYKLTGGTGEYAGISGSGRALSHVIGVAARDAKGRCSLTLAPIAFQFVTNSHGPVRL